MSNQYRTWSKKEELQLIELYKTESIQNISKILNRSCIAIKTRITKNLKITRPKPAIIFQSLSDNEKAYIAGIVDGEGHIGIHRANTGSKYETYTCNMSVHNSDKRLCEFLHKKCGGYFGVSHRPNKKTYYRWSINNILVYDLLRLIYKFLVIKKEQADIIFQYENTLISKTQQYLSVPQTTKIIRENLYNKLKLLHHIET